MGSRWTEEEEMGGKEGREEREEAVGGKTNEKGAPSQAWEHCKHVDDEETRQAHGNCKGKMAMCARTCI